MRAVVLVGGFGTRLRPLTLTTPKPLLPVGHVTILEHVVGNLARAGITEAVLSLGFRPDAFLAAFPDGDCAGVRLVYAVEPEPLDTAGAIRFAARRAGIDEQFVVVNGDVLTDLDITTLVDFHRSRDADASIHLTPVKDPSAFGVVPTDDDGRVLAFIEKPPRYQAPTNLINGGTYVLEPGVLDLISPDRKVSIERETFPALVRAGRLFAESTLDYWIDTGRPDLYLEANLDLLDGRRRVATTEAIGPDAAVDPNAYVAHSVVGEGSVVAGGAEVLDSVLLRGAIVKACAHLRRCIVGAGAVVGADAELDGCVLGDGVRIEPHTRLRDVRVPEPM